MRTSSSRALTPDHLSRKRASGRCGHVGQRNSGSQPAGKGHFGGGHRQSALGKVVTRTHQPRVNRLVQRGEGVFRRLGIDLGHFAAGKTLDQRKMRAAQLVFRHADEVEQVAGLFQVHRHAMAHVVDLAQGTNQQRRRNRDRFVGKGQALCNAGASQNGTSLFRHGRNSLFRLSLPLMNGVPSTVATS